jgi:hypothetical protein
METELPFETVVAELAAFTNQSKAEVLQHAVNLYYYFVHNSVKQPKNL